MKSIYDSRQRLKFVFIFTAILIAIASLVVSDMLIKDLAQEERQKMEQVEAELDFYSEQLVKLLRRHKITDPIIWLHQPEAIVDPKELVEVRHNLIVRRQKLRKQIEYNTNNAKLGQDEMKEMVSDYPQYANEILKKVSDYESRYQ